MYINCRQGLLSSVSLLLIGRDQGDIVGKIDNFDIKLDKIKHSCLQMAEKDVDMAIKDCQNYCAPLGALDSIEEQWKRYKVLANDDYR